MGCAVAEGWEPTSIIVEKHDRRKTGCCCDVAIDRGKAARRNLLLAEAYLERSLLLSSQPVGRSGGGMA